MKVTFRVTKYVQLAIIFFCMCCDKFYSTAGGQNIPTCIWHDATSSLYCAQFKAILNHLLLSWSVVRCFGACRPCCCWGCQMAGISPAWPVFYY